MHKNLKYIFGLLRDNLELVMWLAILVLVMLPMPADQHFTLCPFQNLGLDYCPGCGLGRSCNLAFRGKIIDSLRMHPFGIFAIIVITFRIYSLSKNFITPSKTKVL